MARGIRHLARLVAFIGVVVVAALPIPAEAAWPGDNGRIAFEMRGAIYSIQPTGADLQQLTTGPDDHEPRWSPNGDRIVFERGGDLWLMRPNGSHARRFTSGSGDDSSPGWSADGNNIVFVRSGDGSAARRSIFVKPVGGGTPTRLTQADDGCADAPTWSSDNRFVVFADDCRLGPRSVRKVDLATGAISDVVGTGGIAGPGGQWHFDGSAPDVTPNGLNVVFTVASPDGICGVGITDLSGGGFRQIARGGDCGVFLSDDPAVSPDGRRLVYTAGNENPQLDVVLMSADNQCCNLIFSGIDFPFNPDWRPIT